MEGNEITQKIAELKKQQFEKAWQQMAKCENLKKHLVYVGSILEDDNLKKIVIDIERAIIIGKKTTFNWEDFVCTAIPKDAESDVTMSSEDDVVLLTENGLECSESDFADCDHDREIVYANIIEKIGTWYNDEFEVICSK